MSLTTVTFLSGMGLLTSFVGTVMMFTANPDVDVNIGVLPNGKDLKRMAENKKWTSLFRSGMAVLSIGFLFQFLAFIVPLVQKGGAQIQATQKVNEKP